MDVTCRSQALPHYRSLALTHLLAWLIRSGKGYVKIVTGFLYNKKRQHTEFALRQDLAKFERFSVCTQSLERPPHSRACGLPTCLLDRVR